MGRRGKEEWIKTIRKFTDPDGYSGTLEEFVQAIYIELKESSDKQVIEWRVKEHTKLIQTPTGQKFVLISAVPVVEETTDAKAPGESKPSSSIEVETISESPKPISIHESVAEAKAQPADWSGYPEPETIPSDAIKYDGPDKKRFEGTVWFRRRQFDPTGDPKKDMELMQKEATAESQGWEVRWPTSKGGDSWQFEVPTAFAFTNYIPHPMDGTTTDIKLIQAMLRKNKPFLSIGHTGVGKTVSVGAALADPSFELSPKPSMKPWELPRVYRAVMANMSYEQLIGQFIPNPNRTAKDEQPFVWQDGVLTRMVSLGGVFIADEINGTAADVLMAVNSLLDKGSFIMIPQNKGKIIKAHSSFRFVAAMNPSGYSYEGVKELNIALRSRFEQIFWYGWDRGIENKKFDPSDTNNPDSVPGSQVHKLFDTIRGAFVEGSGTIKYPPGIRDLLHFKANLQDFGINTAIRALCMVFASIEERRAVLMWAKTTFTAKILIKEEDIS